MGSGRRRARECRRLTHELEAHGGIPGLFRARAKHRADRDVIDGLEDRISNLLHCVGGQPNEGRPADRDADVCRSQILLADMNTGGATQPGHIRAIVDNHDRLVRNGHCHHFVAQGEIEAACETFGTNLQKARAACQTRPGQFCRGPAGAPGDIVIENRIERRESRCWMGCWIGHTAWASRPLSSRLPNRSMKEVLSRPAAKSGS